jgi:hypothetical protein
MSDPTIISNDEDWLDLGDGAEALVRARLDAVGRDATLVVSFADWSQMAIAVHGDSPFRETGLDRLRREAIGRHILLPVVRTEDGLAADAGALIAAEIV